MRDVLVTTSWDDGHKLDVRLAALLKKYDIRATFYLSPKDREISAEHILTDDQVRELSKDFEIGAHTMTHCRLPRTSDDVARGEIERSRSYLEKVTGREVKSFCYPRGEYRKKHVEMVRKAGFTYARTVSRHSFRANPLLESPTTIHAYDHWSDAWKIAKFARFSPAKFFRHFLHWDILAKAMFDHALEHGGVYHLWGHSWEIDAHTDWERLETVLAYIAHKRDVAYVTNAELTTLDAPRLLVAIPYFPPYHGGTQMYAYNIAKRLQSGSGLRVCVVTSGQRGFSKVTQEQLDGLTLYRLPYWFKISNTPINPLWPLMIRRIIKRERISIVNAHAPVPFMSDMVALVAGKIPFVLTYHTGSMRKGTFFADVLIWLYEHVPLYRLLRRADLIICPSDFVRLGFLNTYTYKSTTITPGVDTDIFKPGERPTNKRTILFVAGLTRSEQHKGLKILIRAVEILLKTFPEVQLVIVGEGNMRPDYEKYVRKLGLQESVTFRGRLSKLDLVSAYQESDIFILPSLTPAESFGMVLIEAMASGKPVVGSISGGIPLVIDNEKNGLLVPSGDPEALAMGIKRLLEDPALARRLGEEGLKNVRSRYNWDTLAAQHSEVFKEALEKSLYAG